MLVVYTWKTQDIVLIIELSSIKKLRKMIFQVKSNFLSENSSKILRFLKLQQNDQD